MPCPASPAAALWLWTDGEVDWPVLHTLGSQRSGPGCAFSVLSRSHLLVHMAHAGPCLLLRPALRLVI